MCGSASLRSFCFSRAKNKIACYSPAYTLANLAALLGYGAVYAVSYLLSIYLQTVLGYNSQTAGLILIASPAVMAVLSPLAGRLSDRILPFFLAAAGMAVTALSLLIFVFVSEDTHILVIIGALLLRASILFSGYYDPIMF